MDKMVTPETSSSRTDDRSADTNATHETDMQVVDGLETTGKMISVSELDLNVLHALNGFNRQDRKRMAATNGDKYGESKDFAIDPNLISAFMFGGGGDLNPMLMTDGIDGDGEILAGDGMDGDIDTGNPFRDGFEETQPDDYDNYNGNFINPFDDDEPNELQQADSLDEMGLLQQRMKLMKLLQQQYELMHDYNMHDQGQGQGHDKFDNRGDDNLMDPIKEDNELIDDHDHLHIGVMGHHGHGPADSIDVEQGFNGLL